MKAREVKAGDVIVIGHQVSETMDVIANRPLDIEWGEDGSPQAKADTAYNLTGVLENGVVRTVTLQGYDEVEVR